MVGSGKALQKRSTTSGAERRTSPRLPPTAFSSSISVTHNSFDDLALVNISRGGALLQSQEIMRPNIKIALKIAVAGAIHKVMGRVIRSNIVGLQGGLQYHSAVVFDREFAAMGELVAVPEVISAPGACDEVFPLPAGTEPSTNIPQAPPDDDFGEFTAMEELVAVPEVISAPGACDEVFPLPAGMGPSTNIPQAPPDDDFVYTPEKVLVAAPASEISHAALLQALQLNRW